MLISLYSITLFLMYIIELEVGGALAVILLLGNSHFNFYTYPLLMRTHDTVMRILCSEDLCMHFGTNNDASTCDYTLFNMCCYLYRRSISIQQQLRQHYCLYDRLPSHIRHVGLFLVSQCFKYLMYAAFVSSINHSHIKFCL